MSENVQSYVELRVCAYMCICVNVCICVSVCVASSRRDKMASTRAKKKYCIRSISGGDGNGECMALTSIVFSAKARRSV